MQPLGKVPSHSSLKQPEREPLGVRCTWGVGPLREIWEIVDQKVQNHLLRFPHLVVLQEVGAIEVDVGQAC